MSDMVIVALISVLGTITVAIIGTVPVLLPLLRRTKEIAAQVTPNGGNTNSLGDRVVRTEAHAESASRLAGEAAVRADITAQELSEYRDAHQQEAAGRDARLAGMAGQLDALRQDLDAGRIREATYLASLQELGFNISIPTPDSGGA